jgi:hypothetical protein
MEEQGGEDVRLGKGCPQMTALGMGDHVQDHPPDFGCFVLKIHFSLLHNHFTTNKNETQVIKNNKNF